MMKTIAEISSPNHYIFGKKSKRNQDKLDRRRKHSDLNLLNF